MVQTMNYVRIVGNGACEALFNGEIQREISRQNEIHRRELEGTMAMCKVMEASRNRMLTQKLAEFREKNNPSVRQRLKERTAVIWAVLWAWMLEAGLIKNDDL